MAQIEATDMTAMEEGRRKHVPLFNDQKLKLGLFATNCSYGTTISHAATTYRPTWPHTLEIAKRADALGLEVLVPIARWRGFGGTTDFNGECFETYTWAAGLASATDNIMVVSTSHVPTMHPIVAAKASVTVDHISHGRFGLNIVMGWFTPEMEMFGGRQRDHDERYRYGAEWIHIVKRLWTDSQPFDVDGDFVSIHQGQAQPKPVQKPYPVLINAGNSPAGIDYSAREVDFNFISMDTIETGARLVDAVKGKARNEYNRDMGVMTYGLMICRDTEREARAVYDSIIEHGDWEAATNVMRVLGIESESFGSQIRTFQERFIAGWGGYPLIGTPEQVVQELKDVSDAGVDGIIFGFLDYNEELKHFGRTVLPLMKEAGLRH